MAAGESSRIREAASSIASGRPSIARHTSTIAPTLSSVTAKSDRTRVACCVNSWTEPVPDASAAEAFSSGRTSGGTACSCSHASRRARREARHDREVGRPLEQLVDGRLDAADLLEVVEDEEKATVAHLVDERRDGMGLPWELQDLADRGPHLVGAGGGGERDEPGPADVEVRDRGADGDGEAALARSAGPVSVTSRAPPARSAEVAELAVAAHQGPGDLGQRADAARGPDRRELVGQARTVTWTSSPGRPGCL